MYKLKRSAPLPAAALLAALAVAPGAHAQTAPSIGATDIGGVVTGANGPEAGVWVIAETTDLGTKFAKMVATDDAGRYVIPDLPNAKYKVWVRGYGLVDSARVDGTPGKLSVSIATVSATSTLIHTGFNIETDGTPVPTVGLADLDIDVPAFASELLHRYADEMQDIWLARCKVRAVSE